MSDLVGNPEDRFSHNEAQMKGSINLLYGNRHSWAVSKFVSVDHVSACRQNPWNFFFNVYGF